LGGLHAGQQSAGELDSEILWRELAMVDYNRSAQEPGLTERASPVLEGQRVFVWMSMERQGVRNILR